MLYLRRRRLRLWNRRRSEEDLEEEALTHDEPERPLKRLRLRGQGGQVSPSVNACNQSLGGSSVKRPKVEEDELPKTSFRQQPREIKETPQRSIVNKGKQPLLPQIEPLGKRSMSERTASIRIKEPMAEPMAEPGIASLPKPKVPDTHVLIKPKDEPFTDDMFSSDVPDYEVPIAVIRPDPSSKVDSSVGNDTVEKQDGPEIPASMGVGNRGDDALALTSERETNCTLATIPEESPPNVEIASSPLGEEGPDVLERSSAQGTLGIGDDEETLCMPSCTTNGSVHVQCPSAVDVPLSRPMSLSSSDLMSIHDVNDITKGEERDRILWVNEINGEHLPPFKYIPQNLVFQNASVNFALSRIGDEDCCSSCLGDCLFLSTPCHCANETGGQFAYAKEGLLREEFLEECISITRDSQRHQNLYCRECPLERVRNDVCLEPCKGHLRRKFIKECWSKCGCSKNCGNRVVQRGITCKLQVFCTSEGKGWGLRTLEDLPKGAFVCEYAGEILTNTELYDRNLENSKSGKPTYSILLDADWGSGDLKNEEALCLDATFFGNVARFINHRCLDANLVEIPVKVESPDRIYYHLAFFTTRVVTALEELTWDYGINFDDHDQPVKGFCCRCGSKFCRNMKRSTRSRSASIVR
ncbi:hypothetical protein CIPAW_03G270100 [Carya illinoinensis]|uniref:Uncharacterized protein n=1 Tax=Carya illinoinensis TaxID=32201 RepID=A0A8T1R9Q1_CARIL|nr:hypothetical protein CIPAW_03G270100 [Carya illinoinensis]KAG6662828.1 hypothetical protein CIPAW_03G270100 [Carya illinoinensis]KAG6662829.1 hypothetical protein CIPAW_03G270100 [Carya illinoinensis]